MGDFDFKKDQLYYDLRQKILSGFYPSGMKLPAELVFCRELGVGKVTLRSALGRLEQDGLVFRHPGKGTIIKGRGKSNRILIVVTRGDAYYVPNQYIIPGVEAAAAEYGLETETCFIDYLRRLDRETALNILRQKDLRGVVLMASSCRQADPEIQFLQVLNLPVVLPHGEITDHQLGMAVMYTDNRKAWRESLEYLARSGHRRIAVFNLRRSTSALRGWEPEELDGLCDELNFRRDVPYIFTVGAYDRELVRLEVDNMLAAGPLPTAIQCYSDFLAIDVMEYLQEKGYRIPEDIAVMGYCGYPGDSFLNPSLSTMDFDYVGIGRSAVELLMKSGEWFGKSIPLIATPYRLIERQSTRTAKTGKKHRAQVKKNILAAV